MSATDVDEVTLSEIPMALRVERPVSLDGLAEIVGRCGAERLGIFPRGGGTALDYGGALDREGVVVDTTALSRVVDYPSGDMTITIEAGMTLGALQATLATAGQRLPLDAPRPDRATLGGIFATNTSGLRRFGAGRPRDMILGVAFATPDGSIVRGGGRVVKNVAGYDFPRLLTGSLGTLGVIAELTLKVRPRPEASAIAWSAHDRLEEAAAALDLLNLSRTRPIAIELLDRRGLRRIRDLGGSAPDAPWALAIGYEENRAAVAWQLEAVRAEVGGRIGVLRDGEDSPTWAALVAWTEGPGSPVVLRANVRPSGLVGLARLLVDAGWAVHAHAGNGIVRAAEPPAGLTDGDLEAVVHKAREAAVGAGGNLVVARCPAELKPRLHVWGEPRGDWELMRRVRGALDPHGLMNPGRLFATIRG